MICVVVLGSVYALGMVLWLLARDGATAEGHDDAPPCEAPCNGHVDGLHWWPVEAGEVADGQ